MSQRKQNDEALKKLIDEIDDRQEKKKRYWWLLFIPLVIGLVFIVFSGNSILSAMQAEKESKQTEQDILDLVNGTATRGEGDEEVKNINDAMLILEEKLKAPTIADDSTFGSVNTIEEAKAKISALEGQLITLEEMKEKLTQDVQEATNEVTTLAADKAEVEEELEKCKEDHPDGGGNGEVKIVYKDKIVYRDKPMAQDVYLNRFRSEEEKLEAKIAQKAAEIDRLILQLKEKDIVIDQLQNP